MEPDMTAKRCLAYARTATEDADIELQINRLRDFAATKGMTIVAEERLRGVSGRDADLHVSKVIARKTEINDFDVLLMADWTRLTRSGTVHALRLLDQLREAGIEVIVAQD